MHCLSRHRFWSWVEPATHCFFIRLRLRQRSRAPFKYRVPGDDSGLMLTEPHVHVVAAQLKTCLERAQAAVSLAGHSA